MTAARVRDLPGGSRDWQWPYLFPAARLHRDASNGGRRRQNLHELVMQRPGPEAAPRTGLTKRATCHTFRYAFARHLREDGYDIRTIQ